MSPLLIINADDLGYDPAVNRGILKAMREGIVSSATFMVNMPYSQEAARSAEGLSLGLHFNLTRVAPVSKTFPREHLEDGLMVEAHAANLPSRVVEDEALAQIALFENLLGRKPTHIDVHKHLHLHGNVLEGLCSAAIKQKRPVRSINPAMRAFLKTRGIATNEHFIGDAGKDAYWTLERLEEHLKSLPETGVIELMCHPGYAPTTVKSGYHAQREVELATFLSPRAKEWLSRINVGNFTALSRP